MKVYFKVVSLLITSPSNGPPNLSKLVQSGQRTYTILEALGYVILHCIYDVTAT